MSPKQIKALAAAVLALASSLEASQVAPAGLSAALGSAITFVLGLILPQPQKKDAPQ